MNLKNIKTDNKNAKALKSLMDKGLNLVSGGTDNHMMLVDLTNIDLTGKQAQLMLMNMV